MNFSTETYTQQTKMLRDLNQDLRQKLSSMHSCTEQEMQSLVQWLEETQKMVDDLDNLSSIISLHLNILKTELRERLEEDTSRDWTNVSYLFGRNTQR